jgi:hypothetical protein
MGEPAEPVVRGRCACGKRFRIHHAQPGLIVTCPNCGRPITVTEADLRVAAEGDRLLPLQPEQAAPLEAILLDDAELRPAATGGRPGLTGKAAAGHDEALLAEALHGAARAGISGGVRPSTAFREEVAAPEAGAARRPFLSDLLASFCFAGHRRSALTFGSIVLACAIPWLAMQLLASVLPFPLLPLLLSALATVYVVVFVAQFLWSTLTLTARGDDEIPLIAPDWDVWEDAVRPLLWLGVITALCAAPGGAIWWLPTLGDSTNTLLIGAGLVVGSLFWPIAVVSVAIGQSLWFLRPDWLVRCVFGIGPAYLAPWFLILAVGGALVAVFVGPPWLMRAPLVARYAYDVGAATATFYFGYVLFRTLGLLYRHFGQRFPWRF